MHPLRALLVATGLCLACAPAAMADTATTDLLLAAGDCSDGPFTLDYDLGAASGCNLDPFGGWTGGADDGSFAAVDGLPVTLDASRPVHIEISSGTYLGLPKASALGDETVSVLLTGKRTTGNQMVTLGSGSVTTSAADRANTETSLVAFDLVLTPELAGTYKSITLNTNIAGAVMGGYMNFDGTSFVSLPSVDGTVVFPPTEDEEV